MSRHIHKIEEGSIAYGLDRTFGYWLQVFNYKDELVHEMNEYPYPGGESYHRIDIARYLKQCGVSNEVRVNIALDLPI